MTRTILAIVCLLCCLGVNAQERKVENRPYTDLRPFHFGVIVGTHLQDLELNNVGPIMLYNEEGAPLYTDDKGNAVPSLVSVDQDRWDPGFHVGVLGELRLGDHLAFRLAPTMYFGTRHLTFLNYNRRTEEGKLWEERQNLKSVYMACTGDIIFSAKRFNNHRPYIVAGLTPMFNLVSRDNDYLRLNSSDLFLNVGIGCDFYLPFFKLRPELKFMYGLTNSLDKGHTKRIKDASMLPYTNSVDRTRAKMISLSFYFE